MRSPTANACTWKPDRKRRRRCCSSSATWGRDNLFINFDPANMILYGTGEPIEALKKVGHYVRSVHCKDARWAAQPGQEWGTEVPFGEGDVGAERCLRTLAELGYDGPLTIEREIAQEPERQKAEIGRAVQLIEQLKANDTRLRTDGEMRARKQFVTAIDVILGVAKDLRGPANWVDSSLRSE